MSTSNNSIAITMRSHLTPTVHVEEFKLGKDFRVSTPEGTTLFALIDQVFPHNKDKIGFKVVNGQITFRDTVLADEDTVEVYTLISGG